MLLSFYELFYTWANFSYKKGNSNFFMVIDNTPLLSVDKNDTIESFLNLYKNRIINNIFYIKFSKNIIYIKKLFNINKI